MHNRWNKKSQTKDVLLSAAILACCGISAQSQAQQQAVRLEEIVVTAQKRVQSVQDIPVAVTALTEEIMEVNNVIDVNDLSGLAPNLTVRPAVGGSNLPAFNMRGRTSYGVVAGSDKQVSTYLDGVYIGSPRGGLFTLPDIQQLEVLRGPQGTLFGRNATAGAISIRTRDPAGELQIRQKLSVGNRDHFASETTVDFPAVGPFSAYLTYAVEERDGDIKNLGAGTEWDRTAFDYGTARSPETLGAVDNENIFLSTYLDLGEVTVSYKYDYATDEGTPRGNALATGFDFSSFGPIAPLFNQIAEANADLHSRGTTRPDSVNNAWTLDRDQEVEGHNLYVEWEATDELTVKNTLAYRKVRIDAFQDLTGTSGWTIGDAASGTVTIPGVPFPVPNLLILQSAFNVPAGINADTSFCYACTTSISDGDQLSNELQFDYDGDSMTLTAGVLYYESEDTSGSPRNSIGTFSLANLAFFQDYEIPRLEQGVSYNEAKSYAAYAQAEIHITDDLDFLVGARYTKDEKEGTFVTGLPEDVVSEDLLSRFPGSYYSNGADGGYFVRGFDYDNDNVDYLIGVNYALNEVTNLYAKYSTAFVSGGSVAGFEFEPEEVTSWELGAKADFLDSKLRTNIAIYHALYEHLQSAQSGSTPGLGDTTGIGVLVVDGGELEVDGVELEVTALPLEGLTLAATLGYQNAEPKKVPDILLNSVGALPYMVGDPDTPNPAYFPGSSFEQTLSPEWNGNLSVNYITEPLFANAYMTFGLTGVWSDKQRLDSNPGRAANSFMGPIEYIPEKWVINARISLKDIELNDRWSGEVALWGRNLTDDDELNFVTNFGAMAGGTFEEERSYGIDVVFEYR